IRIWPGPLAEFVLGRIDEDRLQKECLYKDADTQEMRLWQSNFWVSVSRAGKGEDGGFAIAMRQIGALTWSAFNSHEHAFLSKIWQEEFFLALHEGGR